MTKQFIDGYNFRSQFKDKFKISPAHDIIGEHKWRLNLHNGIYEQNYYSVESIARRQSGHEPSLRFWNAESRAKGAGYVQLPVYFLSLSRIFPIGETGKTQAMPITLTPEELDYCIANYRTILSIQSISGSPSIGIEKATAAKTFAGVSDNTHDIFTNSAGEGNITKNHEAFLRFQEAFSRVPGFTYDVCFNSWPLDVSSYNTNDFKKWYSYAESTLGDTTILFDFWCSEHQDNISTFVERFVDVFNRLAERNSVDAIPTITHNDNGENVAIPQAEV